PVFHALSPTQFRIPAGVLGTLLLQLEMVLIELLKHPPYGGLGMDRSNHYEAAFEAYLQWHRLCYVAVDETRRAMLGDASVKSLDFIVHGENDCRLLIDVKGRRFPGGPPER